MIKIVDKSKCCGCFACYNICPNGSISMSKDEEGFVYPKVDESLCVNCGLCETICPIANYKTSNFAPIAYAAYSKNDITRKNSSSGGIFSILSENIIESGGVVYGAAFDEQYNVRHYGTSSIKDIEKLRGSKYVQSEIGETYKSVKKYLENNTIVYFSGTPCQIEGLLNFLGKNYENLITQDIICHGVPSENVWAKYNKRFGKLKIFSFRDKSTGWEKYSIRANNTLTLASNSSYMTAFINGYSLRPSCYKCKFCNVSRNSDITLGDLWGANNIVPKMNDDKGLSLVVLNSEKGRLLFESVDVIKTKINLEDAIRYNPSYVTPTMKPKNRDKFMKDVTMDNFDKLIYGKYCKVSNKILIKRLIKKALGKQ